MSTGKHSDGGTYSTEGVLSRQSSLCLPLQQPCVENNVIGDRMKKWLESTVIILYYIVYVELCMQNHYKTDSRVASFQ